ncbi:TadE/TadG family type IV pilus assembly protein [Phenylobacterium sp.]|jgi:Flp pilus assembly protein TadG|uniref:TadE/TadG family type IV pilus assembly protein n=1 Tax=Phenylobacterium sp. TaxID=1871053 RepID=UPI002F936702
MSPRPTRRLKAALARFGRAREGATAVEFGLVGMIAMTLMFGVLELGLLLLTTTTLENATEAVSRRVRTGEFQTTTANTKATFKTQVCDAMGWLSPTCDANLFVDVRTFGSFSGLAAATPQPGATFNPNTTCWAPGAPTDIVLVRVYYKWKLMTPLVGAVFETMGSGSGVRLLSVTTAFRNEPYSDEPPGGAAC